MREPFSRWSYTGWNFGQQTRITFFALNLKLAANEDLSVVKVEAQDAWNQHYDLPVEYVGPVPSHEWMTAVIVRLGDELLEVGDVLVQVSYKGSKSNRVRVGIGYIGGGPPDDDGAAPTPAPPYKISGQIKLGSQGLSNVSVTLSGSQNETVLTNDAGQYSITVHAFGQYSLAASKLYYAFAPTNRTFIPLSNHQTNIDFIAARQAFTISGIIRDDGNKGLDGIEVTLTDESGAVLKSLVTSDGGKVAFANMPAGYVYTVKPTDTNFMVFAPQSTAILSGDTALSFAGTRRPFTISGVVRDERNQVLNGIEVALTDENGAVLRTAITGDAGIFSLTGVPAGFSYTVKPTGTNFFSFTSQTTAIVADNLRLNFVGARRVYTITGKVTDNTGNPIANASVNLNGAQATTSQTTDSGGNYSFTGIPAGFDYTITPAPTVLLTFKTVSINKLGSNQQVNFNATLRQYIISGDVRNGSGQGVAGITLTISGSQSGTVKTGVDGSYTYTATVLGDYTITPSIEQDYYLFSPTSRSLQRLIGDTSVNFTATIAPLPNPHYVLEFDGSPKSVDYDWFWGGGIDLGHFFWEFWAMPGDNAAATYLLSDGYGGAHSLLFGFAFFNASEPGRYQLFGNIWDGVPELSHITFFSSDHGPASGEWGHFAVGWDGQNIVTYYNGVPVGKTRFIGPRRTAGQQGGGRLLIGGSDHNNFVGRIAQVRGYEGSNPRVDAIGSNPIAVEGSFAPETVFGVGGNLLSYYFRPGPRVADLSRGHGGVTHVGTPRGTIGGLLNDCGSCPRPQFVTDPTGPNFVTGTAQQPINVNIPSTVPAGARVFDSFSRANSTYIFNGTGGLGLTEGGTAGSQVWRTSIATSGLKPFGILNGVGVMLADSSHVTWVETGTVTGGLDIRVDRRPGTWGSGLDTGLSFRVMDESRYFFAYTNESERATRSRTLTVGYYLNGQRTTLVSGLSMPDNWITLRVVTTQAGTINVYADASLIYSVTNSLMATASGAGLYNNSPGLGLVNRWDNFAVYDAP